MDLATLYGADNSQYSGMPSLPGQPAPSGGSGGSKVMDMLGLLGSGSPQGAAINAGAQLLGSMLGKSTASASDARQNSSFDSSNWNVSFGSGGITSSAQKTTENPSGLFSGAGGGWVGMATSLLGLALMIKAFKK